MNGVKSLLVTYGGATVFTWLCYLFRWLTLLGAIGTSLVLLGLLGVTSWLVRWIDR